LDKCRQLVLAGDVAGLNDLIGRMEKEDAATFHSLLWEIPAWVAAEDRAAIRKRLVTLLWVTPGEEAERFLLMAVMNDALTPDLDTRLVWGESLLVLGHRRSAQAIAFLETQATQSETARYLAATHALLILEPERYLPRVAQDLATADESKSAGLIAAMNGALNYWSMQKLKVDYREAIGSLQARFSNTTRMNTRMSIVRILETHATQFKSEAERNWLTQQLNAVVNDPNRSVPADEMTMYREVLIRLESK